MKGDVGKAFLLYSRMAELGYEVAQSNAAWILDKYGEKSMCMGESGFCTDAERHQSAHSLWWQASEQGNEHAALLIGDAYYYGRVCSPNRMPIGTLDLACVILVHVYNTPQTGLYDFCFDSLSAVLYVRVLSEIMIVQQRLICMPNPNQMPKLCLTWDTCMNMAKDFHLIFILPSVTMIKQ